MLRVKPRSRPTSVCTPRHNHKREKLPARGHRPTLASTAVYFPNLIVRNTETGTVLGGGTIGQYIPVGRLYSGNPKCIHYQTHARGGYLDVRKLMPYEIQLWKVRGRQGSGFCFPQSPTDIYSSVGSTRVGYPGTPERMRYRNTPTFGRFVSGKATLSASRSRRRRTKICLLARWRRRASLATSLTCCRATTRIQRAANLTVLMLSF